MKYQEVDKWLKWFVVEPFNVNNVQVSQLTSSVESLKFQYPKDSSRSSYYLVNMAFRDRTAYKILSIKSQEDHDDCWKWSKGTPNPLDGWHISLTDSIYMKVHPGFKMTSDPLIRVQCRYFVTINNDIVGPMHDHGLCKKGKEFQISFPESLNRQKFLNEKEAQVAADAFSAYKKARTEELAESRSKSKEKRGKK